MIGPLLLKPRLLALQHRLQLQLKLGLISGQQIIGCVFSIVISLGIFATSYSALAQLRHSEFALIFQPERLLTVVLSLLGILLFMANLVAALGAFFLSHDLELILRSPIRRRSFLIGKLSEVLLSSLWLSGLILTPLLIAFGLAFDANAVYYIALLVIIPIIVALPLLSACLVVLLGSAIVSPQRARLVLSIAGIAAVIALIFFFFSLNEAPSQHPELTQALQVVRALDNPSVSLLPSNWQARCLTAALSSNLSPALRPIASLVLILMLLAIGCAFALRDLYLEAFSRARCFDHRGATKALRTGNSALMRLVPSLYRAVATKELKLFLRDMTQALQLVLILGLSIIYLYNFRMISALEVLPGPAKVIWDGFLMILNLAVGSLVIAAICTRFVFPSISLEGSSFWIIRAAPFKLNRYFYAKFFGWVIPIGTIASVILASGALAINADEHVVAVSAILSWILTYGLVALALAFGARFSNFQWEYAAQLSSSLGALLYLACATCYIAIQMIPASLLIALRLLKESNVSFTYLEWYGCVGAVTALLVISNHLMARAALEYASRSLEHE